MDKESAYELQRVDCNCNDCIFMSRDMETFKRWELERRATQEALFNKKQAHAMMIAQECPDPKGRKTLETVAKSMRFVFSRESMIHYGNCTKFSKPVSFLPNVCQLATQECFKHRREPGEN